VSLHWSWGMVAFALLGVGEYMYDICRLEGYMSGSVLEYHVR